MTTADDLSAEMRCENCRWWDNSTQQTGREPDTTGLCRVNPPKADTRYATAIWPFTEDTDWCAAHQASAT